MMDFDYILINDQLQLHTNTKMLYIDIKWRNPYKQPPHKLKSARLRDRGEPLPELNNKLQCFKHVTIHEIQHIAYRDKI